MALKDTVKHLRDLLHAVTHDLEKADKGNKAASQRVRTGTVKMEKIAKLYRKESIKNEKTTKAQRSQLKKLLLQKRKPSPAKAPVKAKLKLTKQKHVQCL
ncbi:MAG: histone [Parachlamydiaceae bacterium]|nr:MAG: histone [Parachlamydiaceae bacterium]